MDNEIDITVVCLFCQAPLQVEKGIEFKSGDLMKCGTCGERNDYDSVIEVAKEEGIRTVTKQVKDDLAKTFKNLFK